MESHICTLPKDGTMASVKNRGRREINLNYPYCFAKAVFLKRKHFRFLQRTFPHHVLALINDFAGW